jgi:hypothetical protein
LDLSPRGIEPSLNERNRIVQTPYRRRLIDTDGWQEADQSGILIRK